MKLISWNVNGIRAAERKGFIDYAVSSDADIICLQEIKALPEQLSPALHHIPGYTAWFNGAERKGYSGTALYSRIQPRRVEHGFGLVEFDREGRVQIADYDDFLLYNIYYPNGAARAERLDYKMRFYEAFHDHVLRQRDAGRSIIVCGDVNTAHQPIDLARPAENEKTSGFLPEERAFIDRFIESGFIDTFRHFSGEPEQYTWWDMKTRARERNVGWRIDYFFVSEDLRPRLAEAGIQSDVMGSDHCPISLEIAGSGPARLQQTR